MCYETNKLHAWASFGLYQVYMYMDTYFIAVFYCLCLNESSLFTQIVKQIYNLILDDRWKKDRKIVEAIGISKDAVHFNWGFRYVKVVCKVTALLTNNWLKMFFCNSVLANNWLKMLFCNFYRDWETQSILCANWE